MTTTRFEAAGHAIVPGVVEGGLVDALARAIEAAGSGDRAEVAPTVLRRGRSLYGMRNALRGLPEVAGLARSDALLGLVRPILGPSAFPARALLFDKTPEANWGVPWHQDTTIAVARRVDAPGFGPWTRKAGIDHVRPPVSVLEAMVTLRVHLDDCGPSRGPLQVVPGSHRSGLLGPAATRAAIAHGPVVSCEVDRGDVVIIRPLILHASSPSDGPGHRRVVHLEYAAGPLPDGLDWYDRPGEPTHEMA